MDYKLTREIIIDGKREPRGTIVSAAQFSHGVIEAGIKHGYLIPSDQPLPAAPLTSLEVAAGLAGSP